MAALGGGEGAGPVLRRGLSLRCPRCGGTRLFRGWFAMAPGCPLCGLRFERAQGYFVLWGAFGVIFPIWFFRYSRGLWLALEYWLNPEP